MESLYAILECDHSKPLIQLIQSSEAVEEIHDLCVRNIYYTERKMKLELAGLNAIQFLLKEYSGMLQLYCKGGGKINHDTKEYRILTKNCSEKQHDNS